ncbi:MAG: helix-turn-helix transcriptional regulator [Terriglobales bacterium]
MRFQKAEIANGHEDARVSRVLRITADQVSKGPVDVRSLADACGISRTTLRSIMRSAVGCSPKQYIEHTRLCRAEYLLVNSPLSVKEIMAQIGLSDPSNFSKKFRRYFGASPFEYRSNCTTPARSLSVKHAREHFCSFCPLFDEITNTKL